MGKYDQYKYTEEEMLRKNPDKNYVDAYRKVKRIKGFYIHLLIYLIVNTFIVIHNANESLEDGKEIWRWAVFSTPFYWGVGLVGHGLSVFSRNWFFGKDWEERKIREYMEKEKQNKWE